MTLVFAVGGSLTLTDESAQAYNCKLRDVSIDGGQPTEIDTTTAADTIAQSHESTPTQDRLTLEVLWEDGTSTGSGPAVINPSYNDARAEMLNATNFSTYAATLTVQLWDGAALETIYDGIGAKLIDIQARATRSEAASLVLTFLSVRSA